VRRGLLRRRGRPSVLKHVLAARGAVRGVVPWMAAAELRAEGPPDDSRARGDARRRTDGV